MSSADIATVIIACPQCGTRYQLPSGTLGARGREVQCAQCGNAWQARPELQGDDILFDPASETALDAAFEDEAKRAEPPPVVHRQVEHERTLAEIRAAVTPRETREMDAAATRRSHLAFAERQQKLMKTLPPARARRTGRLVATALLLGLVAGGIAWRAPLVDLFPALAAPYAAIGLGVNVVGVTFDDTRTLMSLRGGITVLEVSARLRAVAARRVDVPPVLVSLYDASGKLIYEWTVAPQAADLDPGEVVDFSTELKSPPEGTARVRLSFTTGRARPAASQMSRG